MTEGVLRIRRTVILVGVPVTLAGVAGLLVRPEATPLLAVALVGWFLSVPAVVLVALACVGLGRTAGIADAVYRH